MRFLAFCFLVFVVFIALQLLHLKPLTRQVDFQVLVEPLKDEGNLPFYPSSLGTSINSFSWNSKRLQKYFHVSEVSGSFSQSFWEPSETDILFKFSLEAKQDVQGQIWANSYDANGIFIQRIPVEESSGSTPLSVPDYLSSLTQGNTKGRFWQWRRKEKKQMFLKPARNTRKVELFFTDALRPGNLTESDQPNTRSQPNYATLPTPAIDKTRPDRVASHRSDPGEVVLGILPAT